jgi:predicted glycogen debranching enzyme
MIQFKRETCGDLEAALSREWLETNGLGGYASSTIIGLNTAATTVFWWPPLSHLSAVWFSSRKSTKRWLSMESVSICRPIAIQVLFTRRNSAISNSFASTRFQYLHEVENIEIEKFVLMIHGENSTVIHYELRKNNLSESLKNVLLEIRPLIAFRDYHGTTHENGSINPAVEERSGLASVTPYQGLPSLHLAHNAIELRKTSDWYRNFEYDAERERGLDFFEDLFSP